MFRVGQDTISKSNFGSFGHALGFSLFSPIPHWIANIALLLGVFLGYGAWDAEEGILVFLPVLMGFKALFSKLQFGWKEKGRLLFLFNTIRGSKKASKKYRFSKIFVCFIFCFY